MAYLVVGKLNAPLDSVTSDAQELERSGGLAGLPLITAVLQAAQTGTDRRQPIRCRWSTTGPHEGMVVCVSVPSAVTVSFAVMMNQFC